MPLTKFRNRGSLRPTLFSKSESKNAVTVLTTRVMFNLNLRVVSFVVEELKKYGVPIVFIAILFEKKKNIVL